MHLAGQGACPLARRLLGVVRCRERNALAYKRSALHLQVPLAYLWNWIMLHVSTLHHCPLKLPLLPRGVWLWLPWRCPALPSLRLSRTLCARRNPSGAPPKRTSHAHAYLLLGGG